MSWDYRLSKLPKALKLLVASFLFSMFFGYAVSFILLTDQTGLSPDGIEESYNGNEDDEEAKKLIFRKSNFEILTTVHSHVFTLGVIFVFTGFLVYFTSIQSTFKLALMIEPLISLVVSFASLILMWKGFEIFKYLAYLSGGLMHLCFILSLVLIARELLLRNKPTP